MAHRLNWSLGHEGKGNLYDNGDISTWNLNPLGERGKTKDYEAYGTPHHDEKADEENQNQPVFRFYVSPTGGLHEGGIGFSNGTAMTDDQALQTIIGQNPAFHKEEEEQQEATPREELPSGGYGHAYNLIAALQKTASENDWPDFHTELKIPRSIRKKIRRWADKLKWPEGSELEDARRYHITILSMEEYDEDFAKWMRNHIAGRVFNFKSTGLDLFGEGKDTVVLRLESPEWTELVKEWGDEAHKRGLEPHRFPGGAKAHIAIGKSNGKWPQGVPDPHVKFDTRMFNINKNSVWHEEKDFSN